jgi:hypothetical protein
MGEIYLYRSDVKQSWFGGKSWYSFFDFSFLAKAAKGGVNIRNIKAF